MSTSSIETISTKLWLSARVCISVLINDTMNEYVQCEMCVQVQNKHYECSVKNGVILIRKAQNFMYFMLYIL